MTQDDKQAIGNRQLAIGNESNRQFLRWGLIGCGDIAQKRVAPALAETPQSELVAVSRANASRLDEFADGFKVRHRFADWRDLVRSDDIDAVYVATPVNLHAEQTIAAIESGKHVLCEKPMAMNVVECDQMISAAKAHGIKLGVSYYRHFYPVVTRMKGVIDSGEIGKPVVAQVTAFEWFNPAPSNSRAWLLNPEIAGGGPMFDFGCHRIQVLLHLFGPMQKVTAVTSTALFDRVVEDTASASFKFETGGVATLTVSHAVMEPRDSLTVFGSEGTMHVDVLNEGQLVITTRDGARSEMHPPARNIHQPLVEDFVQAVISNREPEVTGEMGKAVAEVEEEIYWERERPRPQRA
ncbi:MAG TPA: Gfo/Idh/MocA family oxidoreductase [Pyrinomonadaceae bacterium]